MNRVIALSLAALLLTWGAAAFVVESKTEALQKEYRERSQLLQRYESLKKRWSQKSQRTLQKRLDTMLRIYNVRPEITKRKGRKIYRFTLPQKRTDTVLGKILNMPLVLLRFAVEKSDASHVKVTLEVPL